MAIESLTNVQFDAFRPARNLNLLPIGEEAEWFADEARNILGVLVRDRVDDDWGYVILGRDEESRFRAVTLEVSIETRDKAREQLLEAIAEIEQSAATVFPQGEGLTKKADLLTPVVSVENPNPSFRELTESEAYLPARGIIREIFASFPDPDPNFVRDFQTRWYDARIWELYLYAYLSESNFSIDRSHAAPDFVCTKFRLRVCIEAVTVNPTEGQDLLMRQPGDPLRTPQEITEKLPDFIPIKFGSPLVSKLRKQYWELEHVAGNPLILAIADFHEPGSMVWSGSGLSTYLYGYRHGWSKDKEGNLVIKPVAIDSHKYGEKEIPSGFFSLPGAEHVGAVLFSSSGTISKFNRMGHLLGYRSPRVKMMRVGTYYNHDPNATEPLRFVYEVGDPAYPESWGQGLSLFHNPRALDPVPPELFPDIAHHWLEEGLLCGALPEFHPFASMTHIFNLIPDRSGPDSDS